MSPQKTSGVLQWLDDNWYRATPFLAIYGFVFLFLFVYSSNFLWFLLLLQTPVYWLHQAEEYVFPGRFGRFLKRSLLDSPEDEWPVTPRFSLWINIPIIFIAFPVSAALAGIWGLQWGIWAAYFSVINAASHVGIFFRKGYNPGFFVSLLVNIPVGVFTIVVFVQRKALTLPQHLVGLVIAMAVQLGLMVWGLNVMKKQVEARKKELLSEG